MISGNEINLTVAELNRRNCLLYHAAHLKDFISYLKLGGIPSRELMENKAAKFTQFNSDAQDKADLVFDKVFVNLSDFGSTFNNGGRATPLIYGPILMAIDPSALLLATDVAVCLRSAGTPGYNRQNESLTTSLEFIRLFKDSTGKWIKNSADLKTEFPRLTVGGQPEISCSISAQLIPFSYVKFIVVDPISISGVDLPKVVTQIISKQGLPTRVCRRFCSSRMSVHDYQEIYDIAQKRLIGFQDIAHNATSGTIQAWAQAMRAADSTGKSWKRFKTFQNYFNEGTADFINANLGGFLKLVA
ncbi:MAG TPA: hypothetical protein VF412_00225 [Bdellovibrio sp.]|uniref:hypothetical protein n=1 Tax=Bdellovibrio sp. TaxID=28201 RepID=UPI002EF7429E